MAEIVLGETLRGAEAKLDLQELTTGRTLLCSISRFGKTWTARRIVEQVFGKAGIIIVDVEGEYVTLRDKFPLLIIGKDVPLVPESAEFLADQILEHDLSAIIDGSDPQLDIAAFQEFIARFIERFIAIETKARKPYLWILEELDELAPETGIGRSLCLNAIRKITKKGGKRGLGVLALTQRPAFVSKFVISQCPNRIIGRTEWPDDLAVLRKFARIPDKYANPESDDPHSLKNLKAGEFYVSGSFIHKDELVKVGPVQTTHLGSTPEIVPPAPKELTAILAELSLKLPSIIQDKLAPAVPKVAEIEARLKEKFENQWQVRLARVQKERDAIKNKTEAKYETVIADLNRKLEDAVRHATLKGSVSDLLTHPLIQKSVKEKLSPKQWGFIELLETKGAQDPEHCSLFLEIKPTSVPVFVHGVNSKVAKLVENQNGKYLSRLAKLFPVTEEAQTEIKESQELAKKLADKEFEVDTLKDALTNRDSIEKDLKQQLDRKTIEIKALNSTNQHLVEISQGKTIPSETHSHVQDPDSPDTEIHVDATLRRKLASFNVAVSKETFDVDESSWEGKLLARGVDGFFDDAKGIGKIMGELVRKYGASDSGGNRATVNDRLLMLVSKGILDRKQEQGQWVYNATVEFKNRVNKT